MPPAFSYSFDTLHLYAVNGVEVPGCASEFCAWVKGSEHEATEWAKHAKHEGYQGRFVTPHAETIPVSAPREVIPAGEDRISLYLGLRASWS